MRAQYSADAEAQLEEKERKLEMLRDIVNTDETPRRGPRPAPKPRTYTTPGPMTPARSDPDMASTGLRSRPARNATTPGVPVSRIPAAKSMQGLNNIGTASAKVRSSLLGGWYVVMMRGDDNKAVTKSTQVSATSGTASSNVRSSLLGGWYVVMVRRDDNKAVTKSTHVSVTFGNSLYQCEG